MERAVRAFWEGNASTTSCLGAPWLLRVAEAACSSRAAFAGLNSRPARSWAAVIFLRWYRVTLDAAELAVPGEGIAYRWRKYPA